MVTISWTEGRRWNNHVGRTDSLEDSSIHLGFRKRAEDALSPVRSLTKNPFSFEPGAVVVESLEMPSEEEDAVSERVVWGILLIPV